MSCGFVLQNLPYVMIKNDSTLTGNAKFEGFLVDLLAAIKELVGFTYTIRLTPDGKWGGLLGKDGKILKDGMIGEICHDVGDTHIHQCFP